MLQTVSSGELRELVSDQRAIADLRAYFGLDGQQPFTGSHFETLSGGGDRPEVANRITADDLIAVQMLSVQVPPLVAVDLLKGSLGGRLTDLLHRVPVGLEIGQPGAAAALADDAPAAQAWKQLKGRNGVGWVTAGKLLARKRPRLLPVYDDVVRCAVGAPEHIWLWLHDQFATDEQSLPKQLSEVRARAAVTSHVAPLRVLDVILWMRHHSKHRAAACPGLRA
jgi:hypothetical protein